MEGEEEQRVGRVREEGIGRRERRGRGSEL